MAQNSLFPKQAYSTINPQGSAPYLFICEHASNYIPKEFNNLGLEKPLLQEHIAWDPGTANLSERLAHKFDARAVLCEYSRLLIDCNRPLESDSSILTLSERHQIPGNHDLDKAAISQRQEAIFKPFHAAVEHQVKQLKSLHSSFPIIGIHSFTPNFMGKQRPFKFSILWKHETPFVESVLQCLKNHPMAKDIGFNEPYSAKEISAYTTEYHADRNNLPNLIFEVRQDLLESNTDIDFWTDFITEVLKSTEQ